MKTLNGITWIQTYLGLALDLDAPRVDQIEIEDIAHALSNVCRYNGHCAWHYSVAQHSVYVAELVRATAPELALVGLLHDSAEAYIGDWSSPLKQVFRRIAVDVLDIEHNIERVIGARYGVDLVSRNKLIKLADLITLADEKAALFGPSPRPNWAASSGFAPAAPSGRVIERLSPEQAKARFLEAFERFGGQS
jgi:5'-deoxynucleotidase YfbR-like HD superfamily hydrolase